MMQQAMTDIMACDILIAEVSDKAIGVGIETGYAKAHNKPIIYLRRRETEHSTTIGGISDFQVVYTNHVELRESIANVIKLLLKQN